MKIFKLKKFALLIVAAVTLCAGLYAEESLSYKKAKNDLTFNSSFLLPDFSNMSSQLLYENSSAVPCGLVTIPSSNHNNNNRSSNSSYSDYTIFDFFGEIFEILWLFNNIGVTFDRYPYYSGPYINIYGITDEYYYYEGDGDDEDEYYYYEPVNSAYKDFRFEIESSTAFMFNTGLLVEEVRFEGYFWKFFGPDISHTSYWKIFTSEYTGNLRIGGEFSWVQTNLFNFSTSFQWDHWYGTKKLDGLNVGLIVRSYPISPVTLEWRGNFHCVETDDARPIDGDGYLYESLLEVGFMIDKGLEFNLAWRYASDYNYNTVDNGIAAGIKYYF